MDEAGSLSHTKWECKYHVIFIPKMRRKALLRVPVHGGHDSGLMADSVPASWRTAFRFDGGHFLGRSGMVSAMIPERLGR